MKAHWSPVLALAACTAPQARPRHGNEGASALRLGATQVDFGQVVVAEWSAAAQVTLSNDLEHPCA